MTTFIQRFTGMIFLSLMALSVSAEDFEYKSNLRGVWINDIQYPDTSLFIPTSFVSSDLARWHVFGTYVNRVRSARTPPGCQPRCSDAELTLELNLLVKDSYSFSLLPGIQSLTSRNGGTPGLSGSYLGFRFAKQLRPDLGFSIGGENLIRLDDSVDLGRNGYIGFSKGSEIKIKSFSFPTILNIGLGSGAFSLFHEPVFRTGFRSDRPNLIGDPNNFDFGLVGSVSVALSEKMSFGVEYSGYGSGIGASFKPFSKVPLVSTFYIYDLLSVPDELNFDVTPNLFGNLTYSF